VFQGELLPKAYLEILISSQCGRAKVIYPFTGWGDDLWLLSEGYRRRQHSLSGSAVQALAFRM